MEYKAEASYLLLDPSMFHTKYVNSTYAIIPFSQMKTIAEEAGMPFDYTELNQDETIKLSHIILMSFAGQEQEDVQIGDNSYRIIKEDDTPYLGAMQEQMSIYVLNDEVYKELEPKGCLLYTSTLSPAVFRGYLNQRRRLCCFRPYETAGCNTKGEASGSASWAWRDRRA